jgi:hypothetical protein
VWRGRGTLRPFLALRQQWRGCRLSIRYTIAAMMQLCFGEAGVQLMHAASDWKFFPKTVISIATILPEF